MPPSDVDRIFQPVLVVRSHIEQNRKTMLRMNAAERGVEGHLSDGDAHASRALIAEPEDSFPVADHDAFHIVVARMTQDLIDTIFIRIAEKQASRLSPYLAETLAAFTHGRRVHQRQHLFDVADQERIEKRLVRILQVAEKAVFVEGSRLLRECLHAALNLFIESPDVRRQVSRAGQIRRVRDRRRLFPC